MTKDQQTEAIRLLDEVERGLPANSISRIFGQALRELLYQSHGAASHAPKAARRRLASHRLGKPVEPMESGGGPA